MQRDCRRARLARVGRRLRPTPRLACPARNRPRRPRQDLPNPARLRRLATSARSLVRGTRPPPALGLRDPSEIASWTSPKGACAQTTRGLRACQPSSRRGARAQREARHLRLCARASLTRLRGARKRVCRRAGGRARVRVERSSQRVQTRGARAGLRRSPSLSQVRGRRRERARPARYAHARVVVTAPLAVVTVYAVRRVVPAVERACAPRASERWGEKERVEGGGRCLGEARSCATASTRAGATGT